MSDGESSEEPLLGVVLVVRNEQPRLESAVRAILEQSFPEDFELIISVGPSDDETAEVAADFASRCTRIRVVHNPSGRIPAGYNAGIRAGRSRFVAMANARCAWSPGYLERAVELLDRHEADNVGGVQICRGDSDLQQSISAVMNSPLGAGGARHHFSTEAGPIESVPLGVFRRTTLEALGGYDERFEKNEDYELNHRIRTAGGRVWYDPDLVVYYTPRDSILALAAQYYSYGQWKRETLRAWPESRRVHYLAPPALVVVLAASAIASLVRPKALLVPAGYVLVVAGAVSRLGRPDGRRAGLRSVMAAVTMHVAWGAGLLRGAGRAQSAAASRPRARSAISSV